MIGAVLFQNVAKLDWRVIKDSIPAFCTLFFIVTTYSILQGTIVGYLVYIAIHVLTGDLERSVRRTYHNYFNPATSTTQRARKRRRSSSISRDSDACNIIPSFTGSPRTTLGPRGRGGSATTTVNGATQSTDNEASSYNNRLSSLSQSEPVEVESCIESSIKYLIEMMDEVDEREDLIMGVSDLRLRRDDEIDVSVTPRNSSITTPLREKIEI